MNLEDRISKLEEKLDAILMQVCKHKDSTLLNKEEFEVLTKWTYRCNLCQREYSMRALNHPDGKPVSYRDMINDI